MAKLCMLLLMPVILRMPIGSQNYQTYIFNSEKNNLYCSSIVWMLYRIMYTVMKSITLIDPVAHFKITFKIFVRQYALRKLIWFAYSTYKIPSHLCLDVIRYSKSAFQNFFSFVEHVFLFRLESRIPSPFRLVLLISFLFLFLILYYVLSFYTVPFSAKYRSAQQFSESRHLYLMTSKIPFRFFSWTYQRKEIYVKEKWDCGSR